MFIVQERDYNSRMTTAYGPILIVEDVPNVLELLEVTLRFKGYAVITARNGEECAGSDFQNAPGPDHHRYPDAQNGRVCVHPKVASQP
ncbi:MAG: hypothetical protein MZU91_02095 [Desulfosudis oleivorans]|nr:hypothetical protein [Desulfosudis oleivorans]